MEEFTLRLLDVITNNRLYFYLSCFPCRELDVFVETATATKQKKVHYKAQWNIKGCNIVGQQLLTLVDATCCVRLHTLLHVVAQSFKPVKSFSQYLPPLLFFDHRSVAQQFWILPTLHCRSKHCWELLHPFAHHCQHGRNNFQRCWPTSVGSCCVRLHVAYPVKREYSFT